MNNQEAKLILQALPCEWADASAPFLAEALNNRDAIQNCKKSGLWRNGAEFACKPGRGAPSRFRPA